MDPVKDTLLPDQTQIVRNNTIPPLVYFTNSHFLYLEYSFPQLGPLKFDDSPRTFQINATANNEISKISFVQLHFVRCAENSAIIQRNRK